MDIWCCGVVLYYLLFGRFPFGLPEDLSNNSDEMTLGEATEEVFKTLHIPPTADCSAECKDLLENLLRTNPLERISMEVDCCAFQYPLTCSLKPS